MPIKKRGGGTVSIAAPKPKPKPKSAKVAKPDTAKPATKKVTPHKPIRVKKRGPMTSDYVYLDRGMLVIKTPKPCSRWNQDFRLRIVRDYIEPRTLKTAADFAKYHLDNGYQTTIYKVAGHRVRVTNATQPLDGNPNHIVVLRTDVENVDTGETMFLSHKDPAMRILLVYCFLTGERPGGVPKLNIAATPTK